jgi:hypothetical protein
VLTGEEAFGGQGNDGPFGEKDLVLGLAGEVRPGLDGRQADADHGRAAGLDGGERVLEDLR